MIASSKQELRQIAKARRDALELPHAPAALIAHFPAERFRGAIIAGYAPIKSEMNIWPLLHALYAQGETLALPVTGSAATPLSFRRWTPETALKTDRFGALYPSNDSASDSISDSISDSPPLIPDIVLMPLLAFTRTGERLGYGGGFYDRTLALLRTKISVFACGVAYSAQEQPHIPIEAHDVRLDGILTENSFTDLTKANL